MLISDMLTQKQLFPLYTNSHIRHNFILILHISPVLCRWVKCQDELMKFDVLARFSSRAWPTGGYIQKEKGKIFLYSYNVVYILML